MLFDKRAEHRKCAASPRRLSRERHRSFNVVLSLPIIDEMQSATIDPSPTASRARERGAGSRHHHHVYVVELDHDVWYERRFRDANPGYDGKSLCVYVGMTGLNPGKRFANHKAGIKGNRYVLKFGLRLRPDLYECFNPMPFAAASTMELELAQDYRALGWAVWQA